MFVPVELVICIGVFFVLLIILTFVFWVIFSIQELYERIEKIEHQLYDNGKYGIKTINDRIKDLEEFRNHLEGFENENK